MAKFSAEDGCDVEEDDSTIDSQNAGPTTGNFHIQCSNDPQFSSYYWRCFKSKGKIEETKLAKRYERKFVNVSLVKPTLTARHGGIE